jgi:beta-glucosidase/6-phospho-beta-glucosidase/beta-galactosidase
VTDDGAAAQGVGGGVLPDGFVFGVATAAFQVEGGLNGPGQPANNWYPWEQAGRVEPSGDAVDFWRRPEEALDRAAALGCTGFRLGVEWARTCPDGTDAVDDAALARYVAIVEGCVDRGLEPMVTLHHFTHPAALGDDFWLRPDAPRRFAAWAEEVVAPLAPSVRRWVTVNEINVLALSSWLLGSFPPGRVLALDDAALAVDHLLAAHVAAYGVIHRARPDAEVTTNNACLSVYDYDRALTDVLLARRCGVDRADLAGWLDDRRRLHETLLPGAGGPEGPLRRLGARRSPFAPARLSRSRAVEAVYASPFACTLDAVGLDWYDPMAGRHLRLPGHRTAGGRSALPTRALWDDVPDPSGLTRWLGIQAALTPGLPIWIVENGLCNRVRRGRSFDRLDGWDRPRYLREHVAAVLEAVDQGVPVAGYWHWSLVDNYEWGTYEPRFGLFGVDRDRGGAGGTWLGTDALGHDAAGAYRRIIAGLRAGDRSVLAGE